MGVSNEELLKAILYYQESLKKYTSDRNNSKLLNVMEKLKKLPIATAHLENTGIGRTVNALRKLGGNVGEASKGLVAAWKEMVMNEENSVKKEHDEPTSTSCSSEKDVDNIEEVENCSKDSKHKEKRNSSSSHKLSDTNIKNSDKHKKDSYKYNSGSSSSSGSFHSSKTDRHNHKDEKNKRKHDEESSSEETAVKKKCETKSSESEGSDGDSYYSKSESKRRYSSESSNEEEKFKSQKYKSNMESSDSEDDYKNHKSKKSKSDKNDRKSSKSISKDKTESKKDECSSSREDKTSLKHRSDKSKRDVDCEKYKSTSKSKHTSDSHSKKDVSSSDEESKSKSKHESKSKHDSKSKHEKGSSKSKSHSSSLTDVREKSSKKESKKDYEKDNHKKDDIKKHEDKHKKSKDSYEGEKYKDKAGSSSDKLEKTSHSSSSKHKNNSSEKKEKKSSDRDKIKKTVDTEKVVTDIDCGSGASFAEALGMCEPMITTKSSNSKKKSTNFQEKSTVAATNLQEKSAVATTHTKSEKTEEDAVPPLLKDESRLEPLNINISSLLPEITPNYKPLGFNLDFQPKRILTDDEALSRVISNKNQRTKVYSGNKSYGKVESLFDLCVRILQDNIDALEYTGGVPYMILKPVLERANPDQLFNLEHHNPYLIEDSDELWQLHCQKEFRNKQREELECWREMYMRCLEERERRLNAITANIKQSQDKSTPVRTTKLAYVDSVVKPPRNIARKQAKNGIIFDKRPSQTPSSRLSTLAKSGEAGNIAVPNPGSRAVDRSSSSNVIAPMKPKKAPLMAKTLSLFKNRFRR